MEHGVARSARRPDAPAVTRRRVEHSGARQERRPQGHGGRAPCLALRRRARVRKARRPLRGVGRSTLERLVQKTKKNSFSRLFAISAGYTNLPLYTSLLRKKTRCPTAGIRNFLAHYRKPRQISITEPPDLRQAVKQHCCRVMALTLRRVVADLSSRGAWGAPRRAVDRWPHRFHVASPCLVLPAILPAPRVLRGPRQLLGKCCCITLEFRLLPIIFVPSTKCADSPRLLLLLYRGR